MPVPRSRVLRHVPLALALAALLPFLAAREVERLAFDQAAGTSHHHGEAELMVPTLADVELAKELEPRIEFGGPSYRHPAGGSAIATNGSIELLRIGELAFEPTLGFTDETTLLYQGMDAPRGDAPMGYDATGVVYRTTDGGVTWEDVSPSDPEQRKTEFSGDPYLYVDPSTSRAFTSNYQIGTCSTVAWSDNGGERWDSSVAGCGLGDHQNMFAGPPVISETIGYRNVIYYCANAGFTFVGAGAGCQKSLDGGRTFFTIGAPFHVGRPTGPGGFGIPANCGGVVAPGVVDESGVVYIPAGMCGQPWLAISRDEGLTWEHIQVAGNGMAQGDEGFAHADRPFTSDSQRSFPSHESGVAVDEEGNVYYTWVARDHVAYLAVMPAGSDSFGAPVPVSPEHLTDVTLPAIAVGDPGSVAIAYVGSENAPPARNCSEGESPFTCVIEGPGTIDYYRDATWNGYITVTTHALRDRPLFFTGAVNPPADPLERGSCGQVRCGALGDFFDVTIGPDGRAWAAFADACPQGTMSCDGPVLASAEGVVAHMVGGPSLKREIGPAHAESRRRDR